MPRTLPDLADIDLPVWFRSRKYGQVSFLTAEVGSIVNVVFALRAFSSLTGLALLASRIVCLIVVAWFVVFAVGQSKTAATHQVSELAGSLHAPAQQVGPQRGGKRRSKASGATQVLDEAAETVTSPFSSLTAGASSAWLSHGADTLLALLVYGLGVGFLARITRLRV